ncbi:tRNA pseudouridine55 synthase [Microbacterium endophyticum]|uniref:tRNA pseudouridine synthase B n=1 Tax=Microbacterium endophyticum TaxID=1526412 RepID=A0A7W4YM21_9MICO|nr:tRNA pseudouridine(55) synthase TruB [Microbacterium endophyticum]MBB2976015.1 tRNA pseudouridine55 synthase [Microbacterium endophyticum]NIK35066.1 tRNA pseudouridine55 synthase [Microbacterium endophyticum]
MVTTSASGILLVDKPTGITSHDVVSRTRKALNMRKVGHAGTLDPMATGLLVLGVGPATRLLTFIVGLDKTYEATIRLGVSTDSDDADGVVIETTDATSLDIDEITAGIAELTGDISQVPSKVSAIKVDGRRAYDRVRAGEEITLAARPVTVSRFDVTSIRTGETVVEVGVVVDCSSGTYVRALARDLGERLGVGGHLTTLRRTRIGPFVVDGAPGADDLVDVALIDAPTAAAKVLGRVDVDADEARDLRDGKRITGAAGRLASARAAAVDPDGALIGIVEARGKDLKSAMNMPTGDNA